MKKLLSKRLTIIQRISIIFAVVAVVGSSLIFTKSYFNNKEISAFTDNCFDSGGSPVVEASTLHLDYSLICELD